MVLAQVLHLQEMASFPVDIVCVEALAAAAPTPASAR